MHHLQGDLQFRRLHNGEDLIGYSLVEGNGRDGGTGGLAAVFPAADAFVQGAYAAIPGITDSHAAATLAADQESREEGGAFARRSQSSVFVWLEQSCFWFASKSSQEI